jgi:hypothetical protein
MELHLQSHRWEARAPDWTAAAVSGFVAGAILMVAELLWSTNLIGTTPWATSHKIAAIVMGPNALHATDFDVLVVGVALVTHYVLGILFGMVLAAIIAPFHFDSSMGMAMFTGAIFGLLLYLFNFYGMARLFPWFADMRGWPAVLAHLIFGMATAGMYWQLERREAGR